MDMPNVKTINMNKDDGENSKMNQNVYHRCTNKHDETMKSLNEIIKIHKQIKESIKEDTKNTEQIIMDHRQNLQIHKIILKALDNKYNIKESDEELDIKYTGSAEELVKNTPLKFRSLDVEMLKLDVEDQKYVKLIKKLYCSEKDMRVKRQEGEDSKKQKIKHKECEPGLHVRLLKQIINLYIELEYWLNTVIKVRIDIEMAQKSLENDQIELIKMMTEKHKKDMLLLKVTREVTKLQNLCNIYEKEKTNLLLVLKDKKNETSGTKSFSASISQKSLSPQKSHKHQQK